jgi:hypothetical protein
MHPICTFNMIQYLLATDGRCTLWIFLLTVACANIVYETRCLSGLNVVNQNPLIAQACHNLRVAVRDVGNCPCRDTVPAVSNARIYGNAAGLKDAAISMDDLIDRCRADNGDTFFNHAAIGFAKLGFGYDVFPCVLWVFCGDATELIRKFMCCLSGRALTDPVGRLRFGAVGDVLLRLFAAGVQSPGALLGVLTPAFFRALRPLAEGDINLLRFL